MILLELSLLLLLCGDRVPVEASPKCIEGPDSVNATLGSTLNPTCILRGAVLVVGKFYVNNDEISANVTPIDDDDGIMLTASILMDTLQNKTMRCEFVTRNCSSTGEVMVQGYLLGPSDIIADSISPSTVLLSWTAPFTLDITDVDPDISHYTVYITNLNTSQNWSVNVTETEFNFIGLPGEGTPDPHHTYQFTVSAWNVVGEGNRSEPVYGEFIPGLLPSPSNVTIKNDSSSILLSWTAPFTLDITDVDPDISHYTVYITNTNTSQNWSVNVTETEFNFTGLPGEGTPDPCHTYQFTISAWNVVGEGNRSEPVYGEFILGISNQSGSSPTNVSDESGDGPSSPSTEIPDENKHLSCGHGCIAAIIIVGTLVSVIAPIAILLSVIIWKCHCSKDKRKRRTEKEQPPNPDVNDNYIDLVEQSTFTADCASKESKGSDKDIQPTTPGPEMESMETGEQSSAEITLEEAREESGNDESEQRTMPQYSVKRDMPGGAHPDQWLTYSNNLLHSPVICGEASCHDTIVREEEESDDQGRNDQKGVYQTPQSYGCKMLSQSVLYDSKQKD